MNKKQKTKRARKNKSPLSTSCIIIILLIFSAIALRHPIIDYVKTTLANFEKGRYGPEGNKPDKPSQVKKIQKVKVSEKKVVEVIEVEKAYVAAEKVEQDLFAGQLKHHSFNSIAEQKCFSCHGEQGQEIEGDFNFKKFLASGSSSPKTWARIYRQIAKGEMPPKEEKPLEEDEKKLLLSSIKFMTEQIKESSTTRVLTPNEIAHTMQDLFEIDLQLYNPFTNLHNTYSKQVFYTHQRSVLSPYYLKELYHVLYDTMRSFISLHPQLDELNLAVNFPSTSHSACQFPEFTDVRWPLKAGNQPNSIRFRNLAEPKYDRQKRKTGSDESQEIKDDLAKLSLPAGSYKLKFTGEAINMDLRNADPKKYGEAAIAPFKASLKKLDEYEGVLPINFYIMPPADADAYATTSFIRKLLIESEPAEYEMEFTLKRRAAIGYSLDTDFPSDGATAGRIAKYKFGPDIGRKEVEQMMAKYMRSKKYDFPAVRFSNMSIEGPFNVELNPMSFDGKTKRTVTEVGQKFRGLHEALGLKNNIIYSYIFKDFQREKLTYEDSYRNSMLMFFMSPQFLTLNQDKKDKGEYTRFMSYALHKSSPSKNFTNQYEKLRRSKDSKAFADWLIEHQNFRRFINAFSYQWLKLGEIQNARPDEQSFGIFHAKNFNKAYRIELELFLQNLFRENRPIHELISAEYMFVNDSLKDFYEGTQTHARLRHKQVPAKITEQDFKKIDVQDNRRGGLLAMGAFLTATGNGVDPLPLKRASWILDNILDSPLPPPPDSIDLTEFEKSHSKSLKERLEIHSKDTACFSCHKKMDPLALIMDCYDTIGGVNPNYTADAVKINSQTIRGIDELKAYFTFHDTTIARSFCKKFISFILGRELLIKDEAILDAIIDENRATGYRSADLYASIIKHYFL